MYCFVKRFLLSGSRRLASWLLAFALLPSISGHAHGEALASTYIKLYGLTLVKTPPTSVCRKFLMYCDTSAVWQPVAANW
jgi:hypothetical protein